MKPRGPCSVHGAEPSEASCRWCARRMCGPCFRFLVGLEPACVLCAREISTRRRRRAALAVVVGLVGVGALVLLYRRGALSDTSHEVLFGSAVACAIAALLIAVSGRFGDAKLEVREREHDEPPAPQVAEDVPATHPYRAIARRVVAAASPPVSATSTALIVGAAMVLSAAAVPAALRLPRWAELEVVVGVAFLVLATTLSVVLYRGLRLDDDHFFYRPRLPWQSLEPIREGADAGPTHPLRARTGGSSGCGSGCTDIGGGSAGCDEGAGVLAVIVAVLAVLAAVVLFAWVIVEVSLPLVFLAFYQALMLAIRRAARDQRGCKGVLGAAVGWGTLWAVVYVAPVGVLVWVLHEAIKRGH
jgi:uncharacterized protein (DUF983 family)